MVDIDNEPSDSAHGDGGQEPLPADEVAPPMDSPVIKLVNFVKGMITLGPSKAPPARQRASRTAAPLPPIEKTPETNKNNKEPVATAGPLMTVVVRNEFYRDGFRNVLKIAIAEAIIIVALISTFIAYINAARIIISPPRRTGASCS